MKKAIDLKKVVLASLFCAIAYIVTFVFRFHVMFLTFDLKDTIIAIGSLILGPFYGVMIALVVALIEMLTVSGTGFYGFIMNFLASAVFSFIVGIIYKHKRTFTGALISVITAACSVVAVMILANIFITPFYMGTTTKEVINLIPKLLLPFNICKYVINGSMVLILYKPFTTGLKRIGFIEKTGGNTFSFKSLIVFIICAILIVVSVTFILLELNGTFEFFKR